MREKVLSYLEEYKMVSENDHVIAGVSGGADSVCLFRVLLELREKMGFTLSGVNKVRGLNTTCQFCGFQDCGTCTAQGGRCAYTAMDLGIAIGSAVSTAADRRADNRVLFSAGRAAMNLKLLGEEVCQAVGIPLSASGKSPFFDR